MLVFVTVLTVLLASANAVSYTDCGSKLASVDSVSVSGCDDDAQICVLRRNSDVTISIDFTPTSDVTAIRVLVRGVILGVPLPFQLPQPDGCRGNTCPIKSGEKASYRGSLPVLQTYPKVKLDVEWELLNQDNENIVCVLIPAEIK